MFENNAVLDLANILQRSAVERLRCSEIFAYNYLFNKTTHQLNKKINIKK